MKNKLILSGLVILTGFASCNKKADPTPTVTSGGTIYSFEDANYSDDTTRIAMMTAIDAETTKGKSQIVDATKLKNMFSNQSNPFTNSGLNTSGLQVKDHTDPLAQAQAEKYMDSIAKASLSYTVTYSSEVAGVATASNGTSKYLLAANGIEYRQVLAKFLMGTSLFYQIKDVYLSEASVGNAVDIATMKANWDHAFGLFGVPKNFPALPLVGLKYLGNYSNQVTAKISSNTVIMNAFLTGRAAILFNDLASKEAQKAIIISKIEEVLAAAAIHELNSAKLAKTPAQEADIPARNHLISEGMGFVLALKFEGVKISDVQADAILANFPSNIYVMTDGNIDAAIDAISTIYGLDSVKATL